MRHRLFVGSMFLLLGGIVISTAGAASVQRDLDEVRLDLGGTWKIAYDAKNVGLRSGWATKRPDDLRDIKVPSCFEETREGAGYDGVVWYFHRFTIPDEFRDKALYLEFDAVNYACRVWLNGKEIGGHQGGYHRFRLPLGASARIKETNDLVVRVVDPGITPVDGLTLRAIPHGKESWYFNFGGIYRPVRLLGKPPVSIEDVFVEADPETGKMTVHVEVEKRTAGGENPAIEFKVAPKRESHKTVASAEKKPDLRMGTNRLTVELRVDKPKLWALDENNAALYQVTVAAGKHSRRTVDFGFRSFTIENGDFHLNGKRIFLKAVLYQPYFPRTLAYPQSDDFVRREVDTIKQTGFNTVRFHAAVAPPAFLKRADERGLMVIEEPSLGWVYGPPDKIAKPALSEVEAMVLRDRNHPSIVAWGTISQDGGNLAKLGDLLARRALQLDPTRVVFGDWPVRWTEAAAGACFAYLPGRTEPLAIGAGEIFPRAPLPDEEYENLNTLGTTSSLNFVSAFGSGGITNLNNCLDGFQGRDYLEDYQLLKRYRDNAEKDFRTYRLQGLCGSLNNLCNHAQRAQSDVAREMIEALRSNPNVDGYCYRQWRDAGRECTAGLTDIWLQQKQDLYRIRSVNQSLALTLRFRPEAPSLDQPVSLLATAINDGDLKGKVRVQFQLRRSDGREMPRMQVELELDEGKRVTRLEPIEWRPDGPTGYYTLRAQLFDSKGKKVAENERRFLYVASREWDLSQYDLMLIAADSRRRSILAATGLRVVEPPRWPKSRVVLAGASGPAWESRSAFEPMAEVLEEINNEGGTLLLDCSNGFDAALERVHVVAGKTSRATGGFLGKFLLTRASGRFSWLPAGQAMMGEYRSVVPRIAIQSVASNWEPQVALVDGYGRFGGYAWAEKRWGAGRVVVTTLPVFDQVDRDPTARLIVLGMLRYYGQNPRISSPGNLTRRIVMGQFEGGGETHATNWWVCGPFTERDWGRALNQSYPPEREFEPKRSYSSGKDGGRAQWRRYHGREDGYINFIEALGEHTNSAAYALTFLHTKKEIKTTLHLGSDDAIRVFLNDREVFTNNTQRAAAPDQDRVEIVLKEGWNKLLVKVVNGSSLWAGYVSVDDPVVWSPDRQLPTVKP